jgi:hypothetical protein
LFPKTLLIKIEDLDFDYKDIDVELGYDMRGSNVDDGDGVGGQVGANVGGFVVGVDVGANIGGFVDGDSDDNEAKKEVGFDVVWVVL